MSDLDAGVLAQKPGIGPERVEKALFEMGVPYSAPPADGMIWRFPGPGMGRMA